MTQTTEENKVSILDLFDFQWANFPPVHSKEGGESGGQEEEKATWSCEAIKVKYHFLHQGLVLVVS